jgi:hypothetical protein
MNQPRAPGKLGNASDPDVGLCATCRRVQRVSSDRGSTFYLCRLSLVDPRYARYPRLPVLVCQGYSPEDGHQT